MALERPPKAVLLILMIAQSILFMPALARADQPDDSDRRQAKFPTSASTLSNQFDIECDAICPKDPDERPGGRFFAWRSSYESALQAAVQNDYQKADQLFEKALNLAQDISPDDERVATCSYRLGALRRQRGDLESSIKLLCSAADFKKFRLWSQHPTVLGAQSELAILYDSQNRFDKADQLYKLQLAAAQDASTSPLVTATILNNRAALYLDQGNFIRAKPIVSQILSIEQKCLPATAPNLALLLQRAAFIYDVHKCYHQAELLHKRAIEIFSIASKKYQNNLMLSLASLVEVYLRQAKYSQALSTAQELAKIGPCSGMDRNDTTRTLARVLFTIGKDKGDRTCLRKSIDLYSKLVLCRPESAHSTDSTRAIDSHLLGEAYLCTGQLSEAERWLTKSVSIRQGIPNESEPIASTWMMLAGAYCLNKNFTESERFYKKALAVLLNAPGDHRARISEVLDAWGFLYARQGNFGKALPLAKKALEIAESLYHPRDRALLPFIAHYAVDLHTLGFHTEAEPQFKRLLVIVETSGDSAVCPVKYWLPYFLETMRALHHDSEIQNIKLRTGKIKHLQK